MTFSSGETTTSSEDELVNRNETTTDDELRPQQPPARNAGRPRPPPSPATSRKAPLAGTSLKLKKGRRSRHRYDSERQLFANADIDPDEAPEGWDIATETRSHFRTLLTSSNRNLLEQFLDSAEAANLNDITPNHHHGHGNSNLNENTEVDPEACFLSISAHLRHGLKKHLPLVREHKSIYVMIFKLIESNFQGMLENLEDQIRQHFKNDPSKHFIASDLTSYERLLAHTCSMYNRLHSQSNVITEIRNCDRFHILLHFRL